MKRVISNTGMKMRLFYDDFYLLKALIYKMQNYWLLVMFNSVFQGIKCQRIKFTTIQTILSSILEHVI